MAASPLEKLSESTFCEPAVSSKIVADTFMHVGEALPDRGGHVVGGRVRGAGESGQVGLGQDRVLDQRQVGGGIDLLGTAAAAAREQRRGEEHDRRGPQTGHQCLRRARSQSRSSTAPTRR